MIVKRSIGASKCGSRVSHDSADCSLPKKTLDPMAPDEQLLDSLDPATREAVRTFIEKRVAEELRKQSERHQQQKEKTPPQQSRREELAGDKKKRSNGDGEGEIQNMIDEEISKMERRHSQEGTIKLTISTPLSKEVLDAKIPYWFSVPQIPTYDGKTDPRDHVRCHIVSFLGRNATDQILCLLFPGTLTGVAWDWFHFLPEGSITNFKQLEELFVQRFGAIKRVKRDATYLFSLEQAEDQSLRSWHEEFFKAAVEVNDLTQREALFAFQRGMKHGEFKNDLIITPPRDFKDLAGRVERYITLPEFLTKSKKETWKSGKTTKESARSYQGREKHPLPAGIKRVKKDATYIFSLKQAEDQSLRSWYEEFFEAVAEVHDLTPREALFVFEQGMKHGDFKKNLIMTPPRDFKDISERAERYIFLEDSLTKSNEETRKPGERTKESARSDQGREKKPLPAGIKRVKRHSTYVFSLEQAEDQSLRSWYEEFFKAVAEVHDLTPREAIFAFQRGMKRGDFKKNLIMEPPIDFKDLAGRVERYITLEELLTKSKKETWKSGKRTKESARRDWKK